jgi:hypothetical protein
VVAPWSAFWFRNVFAQYPAVAHLLANVYVRGAVTGIGLMTALAGLAELAGALPRRRQQDPPQSPAS